LATFVVVFRLPEAFFVGLGLLALP